MKTQTSKETTDHYLERFDRRFFLKIVSAIGCLPVFGSLAGCEEELFSDDTTILEVEQKIRRKILNGDKHGTSVVALTKYFLANINKNNKAGHALNAVLETNETQSLKRSMLLDSHLKQKKNFMGPLHGIPILIKDSIQFSGMQTTAGTPALSNILFEKDAAVVTKLLNAGAVIIGKANLSELNGFRDMSSDEVIGWSSLGGKTKNPYVLKQHASGSSSGSAVGLSAKFAAQSIAVDTHGSAIGPAMRNSLFCIRPSTELIDNSGIVTDIKAQDSVCPMTRNMTDLSIMLEVMSGKTGYQKRLNSNGLKGKKIGILPDSMIDPVHKDPGGYPGDGSITQNQQTNLIKILKDEGALIVEINPPTMIDNLDSLIFSYVNMKTYLGLNDYLKDRAAFHKKTNPQDQVVSSLEELIAYNKKDPDKTYIKTVKQSTLEKLVKEGYEPSSVTEFEKKINSLYNELIKQSCDVWLGWFIVAPELNLPMLAVPYGENPDSKLPAGQVLTHPKRGAGGEGDLIEIGYALEQALKRRGLGRYTPKYLP